MSLSRRLADRTRNFSPKFQTEDKMTEHRICNRCSESISSSSKNMANHLSRCKEIPTTISYASVAVSESSNVSVSVFSASLRSQWVVVISPMTWTPIQSRGF
ncbi:hypothetical protein BDEG_20913 [Batrachochytrium dendrobatidis JEL423]|uniref:Uncharacterized protein n=1 Tax=Batrachochytrium dendrobatidis (strain JEL423) TaxID=403673 RepID=A0A177W9M1_BATDL|nr:hypothetical protein BDEG_20913 [Batrachochytrium dendrobatidis JEL423]